MKIIFPRIQSPDSWICENTQQLFLHTNFFAGAGSLKASKTKSTQQLPAADKASLDLSCQERIVAYFAGNKAVKFAYLFGSYAKGQAGPLSDFDLAIYLDNRLDFFTAKLKYLEELYRLMKNERCDLVVLNKAPLLLQYEIIRHGKVLKENRQKRIPFETHVLREYLDTEPLRAVHRQTIKEHFLKGRSLGQ